jgi:hypothetical protein
MVEAQLRFGTQVVLGLQFEQLTLFPRAWRLPARPCPTSFVCDIARPVQSCTLRVS